MQAVTAELPAGATLDGRYQIERLLATGGMGAVYVAQHLRLKKRVAVKILRSELARDVGMLERFQREAVAASAIGHRGIVQVNDMGTTPDGIAYMVMELLAGRSLGAVLNTEAPLPAMRAARLASEILDAVAAAHDAGIIHRDLKPENVFLLPDDEIKLLDFGISSFSNADATSHRLTSTGMIMGTPNYMSAEQARGDRDVTPATDVYAVGVILYEMLSGKLPYVAENYNQLMYQIVTGDHTPLAAAQPGVPPELAAIVERALEVEPGGRFGSAREMAQALARVRTLGAATTQVGRSVDDLNAIAMAATLPPTPSEIARSRQGGATQQPWPTPGARRWMIGGAVLVTALAAAVVAPRLIGSRQTPRTPARPVATPQAVDARPVAAAAPTEPAPVATPDAAAVATPAFRTPPVPPRAPRRPRPQVAAPTDDAGVVETSPYAPTPPPAQKR